jgi:hypothetical protein
VGDRHLNFHEDRDTLGANTLIYNATYNAEHQCSFWSAIPPVDLTA